MELSDCYAKYYITFLLKIKVNLFENEKKSIFKLIISTI